VVKISIPFSSIEQFKNHNFMKLHHASNHAILLAEWCKDQGLIMGLDFEWAVWSEEQFIEFKFIGRGEKYSSMFALKFGEGSA
jgi:hypothetical protein